MRVKLNDKETTIEMESPTLYDVLLQSKLPLSRTAVKVNNAVVPRSQWKSTSLHENDNLETILMVSGG